MREPFSVPGDLETWHPLSRKFAFLARPKTRRGFIWLPAIVLAVMTVAGLFVHPHDHAPWDFFAAWSLWGFLSYSFVVLMARPLFALLARPEGVYEGEWTGGVEDDVQIAPSIAPEEH